MKHRITLLLTTLTICTCTSCVPATAAMETEFTCTENYTSEYTDYIKDFTDGSDFFLQTTDLGNIYPLTGLVTHIEYEAIPENDLIFITCANGNEFSFYAPISDCWAEDDLATCIMDSKGTRIVYDDEVLKAHYAGTLDMFFDIK